MSAISEGRGAALVDLGAGGGSAAERIKLESHHLQGRIAGELAEGGNRFSADQVTVQGHAQG